MLTPETKKIILNFLKDNVNLVAQLQCDDLFDAWLSRDRNIVIYWTDVLEILCSPEIGYTLNDILKHTTILRSFYFNGIKEGDFVNIDYSVINVPSNIQNIGGFAFSESPAIHQIIIEPGVKLIADVAINNCNNLQGIEFPDTATGMTSHSSNWSLIKNSHVNQHDLVIAISKNSPLAQWPEDEIILDVSGKHKIEYI